MDNRQEFFGNLRVSAFGYGKMLVPTISKVVIPLPVISNNKGAWLNRIFNEPAKRLCAPVWSNCEPDASGVATTSALAGFCTRFALFDLYSAGDKNHVVHATAFAACFATNPCFISLDVRTGIAANPVLIWSYHARTEFVKNLKRRFIARKPELSLELHRRHTCGLTGNQISCPEPYMKWCVRALHDRSDHQSGFFQATTAPQYILASGNSPRFASSSAMMTDKAVWPTQPQKVGDA